MMAETNFLNSLQNMDVDGIMQGQVHAFVRQKLCRAHTSHALFTSLYTTYCLIDRSRPSRFTISAVIVRMSTMLVADCRCGRCSQNKTLFLAISIFASFYSSTVFTIYSDACVSIAGIFFLPLPMTDEQTNCFTPCACAQSAF